MKKPEFFEKLANKLCDALPDSMKALKTDMEKNFHAILVSTFNKLDLVTREEFDAQTKVLARTRKKVEALEEELKKWEKEQDDKIK